jgi:hypothetical protein
MGLRRLRSRLDSLQGEANETMAMAQDLLADLKDGVGVTVVIDAEAARSIFMSLLKGEKMEGKITLPISLKIDPSVDTKGK